MQVYISKDDRQWGPYDAEQLVCLIDRKSFSLSDWAWIEGNNVWVPLREIMTLLQNEQKAESQRLRQKVEAARDYWRSQLTQPTPVECREERLRRRSTRRRAPAVATAPAGRGRLGRNIFCGALVLGVGLFAAMLILGGSDEVAEDSLSTQNGLTFKASTNELFQGKAVSHYPNGQLKNEAEYKDGLRHGRVVTFYPTGTMESEGTMEQGVYHGNVTYYHPDGSVKSQALFRNGNAVSAAAPNPVREVLLKTEK